MGGGGVKTPWSAPGGGVEDGRRGGERLGCPHPAARLGFSWPLWAAETLGSREALGDGESERDSLPPCTPSSPNALLGAAWALRAPPLRPPPPPPPPWVKAITNPALRPARGSRDLSPTLRVAERLAGRGGTRGGAEASGTPDPAAGGGQGHPPELLGQGRRAGMWLLLPVQQAFKKLLVNESRGPGSSVNPLPPRSPKALRRARGVPPHPPARSPVPNSTAEFSFETAWLAPQGAHPGLPDYVAPSEFRRGARDRLAAFRQPRLRHPPRAVPTASRGRGRNAAGRRLSGTPPPRPRAPSVRSGGPAGLRRWACCPRPRRTARSSRALPGPGGAGPGGGRARAGRGAQLCCCSLRRDGGSRLAAARPRAVNATRPSAALPARPPAGTW